MGLGGLEPPTSPLSVVGRLLRATGIQPITYSSAEAFLADTRHPEFDCLVLDIQLGGMSGIELAQEVVAKGGHTPFIYITAFDDPEVRATAEAMGCAGYFRKTDFVRPFARTISLRGVQ